MEPITPRDVPIHGRRVVYTGTGDVMDLNTVVIASPDEPRHIRSEWQPSADDLAHLASGGTILLDVFGGGLPPVRVFVQPK